MRLARASASPSDERFHGRACAGPWQVKLGEDAGRSLCRRQRQARGRRPSAGMPWPPGAWGHGIARSDAVGRRPSSRACPGAPPASSPPRGAARPARRPRPRRAARRRSRSPSLQRGEERSLAVGAVREVAVEACRPDPRSAGRGRGRAGRGRARACAAARRGTRQRAGPGSTNTLPRPSTASPVKQAVAGDERDVVGRMARGRERAQRPERVAVDEHHVGPGAAAAPGRMCGVRDRSADVASRGRGARA